MFAVRIDGFQGWFQNVHAREYAVLEVHSVLAEYIWLSLLAYTDRRAACSKDLIDVQWTTHGGQLDFLCFEARSDKSIGTV